MCYYLLEMSAPEQDKSAGIDMPWPLVRVEDSQVMIEENLKGKPLREIVLERLIADCSLLSADETLSPEQLKMVNGAQTFYKYLDYIFKYVADGSYQRVSTALEGIGPTDGLSFAQLMNHLGSKLGDVYPGLKKDASYPEKFNQFEVVITEFQDGTALYNDPTGFQLIPHIYNKQIADESDLLTEGMVFAEERYKKIYIDVAALGLQQGVQTDHKMAS